MTILAKNKKGLFDYELLEKFEAGISLTGQEAKSIKVKGLSLAGSYVVITKSIKVKGLSLAGSYVVIKNGEAFWIGAKISPYQAKNTPKDYNPERSRRLLLKKSEIRYLLGKTKQKGLTLLPIKLYTKGRKIKMEFALARGRKKADKKELIKKREIEKEIQRELKKYR